MTVPIVGAAGVLAAGTGAVAWAQPPLVFGVLNVTPDSFSDGGKYDTVAAACERGRELAAAGAHVIDVGGESTRPGATPVSREEELARVLPVIRTLAAENITVSIDTIHAETARQAIAAGASIVNDVSGGLADPQMYAVIRETGAKYIVGHWRGVPQTDHSLSQYSDVVSDVRDQLAALVAAAQAAGVRPQLIAVDPGLGFDKTAAQGWDILANIDRIQALGYPVMIGVSRKRMITELLATLPPAAQQQHSETVDNRDGMTAIVSALMAEADVWAVRVHDVPGTAQAIALTHQLKARRAQHSNAADDRITLTGLEVFAHHGVFDFEREQGQRFFIDAELSVSLAGAANSDELSHTVHYGELAEAITAAVANDPVDLIETVAERVAQVALSFAGVAAARITVHKPDAPITVPFGDVSVTVVRSRKRGVQ